MSAEAASSQLGSASRLASQACRTLLGTGTATTSRAVASQLEAGLLAQVLDAFADAERPLGLVLVVERDAPR